MNKLKKRTDRINEEILAKEVRLVGENFNNEIFLTKDALAISKSMGLDLVEISANSFPPTCKIIDYGKLVYERKQKEKLQKQNNKKIKIKEIRLTYNTGDHDFNFKLNHAIEFLKDGDKVKVYVMFSGREIVYRDQGEIILLKFIDQLTPYGKIEDMPKLDGKRLWTIISPKK